MPPFEMLLARVREEYREMPGLRLTIAQAARLWGMDRATCERALETLLAEGFLFRARDGAYVALRGSVSRASTRPAPSGRGGLRRTA